MRIAKQENREFQDMYHVKQMKNDVGQVLLDEEEIKERWRSYFKQLMNVKNDRSRTRRRNNGRGDQVRGSSGSDEKDEERQSSWSGQHTCGGLEGAWMVGCADFDRHVCEDHGDREDARWVEE